MKILQIMSAPKGMRALFIDHDSNTGWSAPIIALALVEDNDRQTIVEAAYYDQYGEIALCCHDEHFISLFNDDPATDVRDELIREVN